MGKQYVSLFLLPLVACGFLFSCNSNLHKPVGALSFDSIQVNRTVHLFGDTAMPACNLVVSLVYADKASDDSLKNQVNRFLLSAALGEAYAGMAPVEALDRYADKYARSYREDLEPMFLKDADESGDIDVADWYSYYKSVAGSVWHYAGHLLTYRVYYEEYTGGAHGIYLTNFLNVDLSTLTPVRLDDLFAKGYEEQLTDLLWNQLMADNHVTTREELQDMGYALGGDIEPTGNFYLDDAGITFYYNVYDIAPYVMGTTAITLSYDILQPLMDDKKGVVASIR
ncbi:MAG: DUF3298 and DUF4163 domain-containing protein [Prevotellaceae bacterium]|nr:DUF3298 and DUF4163 domain-containing protein [Prevotellaceae bacterium]